MTWFKLTGDTRLGRCDSEGCGGQPTWRLEAGGVGSNYCSGCKERIAELPAEDDPDVLLVARAIAERGVGRYWDDFPETDAFDIDQGDLIEYARAAVEAMRLRQAAGPSISSRHSGGQS